jgi:hypothetical protein
LWAVLPETQSSQCWDEGKARTENDGSSTTLY